MDILNSSISSSSTEQNRQWKVFCSVFFSILLSLTIGSYTFVVLVDPYDSLPFSLDLDRMQVSKHQRLYFPALAKKPIFDSAIIGNSNIRLIRPDILDQGMGGRWVNLAMSAASSWEQEKMFDLFIKHHPDTKNILIGIDYLWCNAKHSEKRFVGSISEADFPEWLYDDSLLNNFPALNLGSLEHAWLQLLTSKSLIEERFGRDGYTVFTDPESEYDIRKARRKIYGSPTPKPFKVVSPPAKRNAEQRASIDIPALKRLSDMLERLPAQSQTILMFVPYHRYYQAAPGSEEDVMWKECKSRVSNLAKYAGNTYVIDFMIESPITTKDENYWDFKHYRVDVGNKLSRLIVKATNTSKGGGNYKILVAPNLDDSSDEFTRYDLSNPMDGSQATTLLHSLNAITLRF